ncbi:CoA transferase [Seongchinamella sediminis]|uniref:CoA transferase n=1 Tax=Seongchinamella sediminis TaxID=2283635 RepID=A0A3L7DWE4_9GAMM|nr:CoA transferase [Seongchinamella sediminis]RLQ21095.1 CoA transferase [Seongchinamella sediminis]
MTSQQPDTALAGIRVVEICDHKGSYCGKLLADMGAEVIKVEPPGGDPDRLIPPFLHGRAEAGSSLPFLYANSNKKSVTLDITTVEGQQQLRGLVESADLLLESMPPGMLAGLNLSFDVLRADQPGLVFTSITGFGQSGPHRDYRTSEIVASALGGAMVVTGFPEDPPVKLAGSQAFVMASTMAAISSMIALHHSRATGRGQQVDISIQKTMLAVTSICGVGKWLEDGIISNRFGTGLFASVPSGTYPCKDGSVYIMVNRPKHWQVLARWVNEVSGNQEVLDPMFDGPSSMRQPYRELLDIFIAELTGQFTVEEFYREGQRRHLAVTPLSTAHGIAADPHLNARGFYVAVDHGDRGVLRFPGPPYRFSATPWRLQSPAPGAGEHNHQFRAPGGDAANTAQARGRYKPAPGADRAKEQALAGLRVVEFTAGMAGPWIGRLMAYCGADVIKVESKDYPDVSRLFVPPKAPELGVQSQLSPWLTDWNAGKRCVSLDLTRPEGANLARELIAESDIVIDNNANGVLDKLGLGFESLVRLKPELILCSSTGYGNSGPDASYISWGPNLETLSGLSGLSGFPHRECTMTQFAYPDPLAALYGLFAILCALEYRRKSGRGQQVNISQLEATVASIGDVLLEVLVDDVEPAKIGNRSLYMAPQGVYRCRDDSGNDDRWCAITIASDAQWQDFCRLLEKPEWIDDPQFNSLSGRLANHDLLDRGIEQWTRTRDPYEVMHSLQAAGIAAGVAQHVEDQWLRDPHLHARQFFEEIAHEKKGTVIAPGLPLGLLGTPGRTPHAGRGRGQDNHAVFCQLLGLGEGEFSRLLDAGVIQAPDEP